MQAIFLFAALAAAPDPCAHDRDALLALPVEAFDQKLNAGWRPLAGKDGCLPAAADLIAAYRERHAASLRLDQVQGLDHHEGQLRAAAGDYVRAAELIARSRAKDADPANARYGDATVAFLRRDRAALMRARAELAAIPEPPQFAKAAADYTAKYGLTISWPPNLDVVDGLIACFDKPYREAYEAACRPAK